MDGDSDHVDESVPEVLQQRTPPSESPSVSTAAHTTHENKRMDVDDEGPGPDIQVLSPMSIEADKQEDNHLPALSSSTHGGSYDFSNVRVSGHIAVSLDDEAHGLIVPTADTDLALILSTGWQQISWYPAI